MIALSFCHISRKGKRPPDSAFPKNLVTLGDHIRKRRLTLGLYQRAVAQFIGVDQATIFNWEAGNYAPFTRYMPKIYEFLGYCPMRYPKTIGEKLRRWRESWGLNQEQMAKKLGVDESSISEWETGRHKPARPSLEKIELLTRFS
jgi:transcriptional regulator with XRE-family HTH domain